MSTTYQNDYGACELRNSGIFFAEESQIDALASETQRLLISLDQCEMARLIAGDRNVQIAFIPQESGKGLLRTPVQDNFEILELVSMHFVGCSPIQEK